MNLIEAIKYLRECPENKIQTRLHPNKDYIAFDGNTLMIYYDRGENHKWRERFQISEFEILQQYIPYPDPSSPMVESFTEWWKKEWRNRSERDCRAAFERGWEAGVKHLKSTP